MTTLRIMAIVTFGVLTSACAQVSVERVRSYDQAGIRYWRPAPYLSLAPVVANGTTTCEAKIIMLPDKSEEYAITMSAGVGTAEASPTLQDGWMLTAMTGKADSKTAENITAIATLAKTLLPAGLASVMANKPVRTRTTMRNCSGFYQLMFDQTGQLYSFRQVSMPAAIEIVTSVPPPAPDPKKCGTAGLPPCTQ